MTYEYRFHVKVEQILPSIADMTEGEMQDDLINVLNEYGDEFSEVFNEFDDGTEVVSHSLTVLDGKLLISIMLRRPKP